ncbi:MAG: NifB/NifX family molybdenum-iron cluster-binding protein [Candidatus Bathyarchaeia archaeon]|nr:NifB/NifX family molybdenum-iron cluster-binding protein [Candidatus Bathyarchaeia archaeon]
MSVRIVIPVEDTNGLDARLSQHFGRAPYFAVVELDENGNVLNLQMVPNESEHFGGMGRPPEIIMSLRPNAVITYGMGFRALNMFQSANVAVLQTSKDFVKDVIEAYNKDELVELTEGCHHARHR